MRKSTVIFSGIGAFLTISFLIIINHITTPDNQWSMYPSFVIVFWPIIVYYIAMKKYKGLSLVSALILILFLVIINYETSPVHPWFLYASYPILWWPILMYAGKWRKKLSFAIVSSGSLIAYYVVLNVILTPGYPWFIYTTFTFLWWPIIHYFVLTKKLMTFSVMSSLLTSVFFIIVNQVSTPHVIWAIYPVFVVLWWPLVVYCFSYLRHKNNDKTYKQTSR
ncbi:hypothetical protein HZI73_19720 [Vallitalea pronyensis]|uniref:Uncharacterized protein n=1 Tax=Vallitalea pronyensis TaxID=1348613 RepID=A0A8J8SIF0_9FIRM|nr:hypothetical protein [Vallitalea pronyensis]QUI24387.1 hypothetical protein HZI73_19720 [Vallitalea pronyensis]